MDLAQINEWRKSYEAGTLIMPRFIASSPIVDGEAAIWKGSLRVKNTDEGHEAVRYIKRRGNDFIKVYSFLSREAYFAIADEAKKQDLVFAGHTPDSINAGEASDAGQKSIEHLTGILLSAPLRPKKPNRASPAARGGSGRQNDFHQRDRQTYFRNFQRSESSPRSMRVSSAIKPGCVRRWL